jgi:hypothetical protein
MNQISRDEQRVLNEKAEEIKEIICSEIFSWNKHYPEIIKKIVVTFLELRLDSIFKRLKIPELPQDYMDKYYYKIGAGDFLKNRFIGIQPNYIARNWLRASFYNDKEFLSGDDHKSLQQRQIQIKEKLNGKIDNLKINSEYKNMLINFDFPMSLQKKYARLGWFVSENIHNDKFRNFLNIKLKIGKNRAYQVTIENINDLEFYLIEDLFPQGTFPNNSFWSIFYIFKFNDSRDEINNLREFIRNRKMENLIAIRPYFKIRPKKESDKKIISLEDFLKKESPKIEDYEITINEEYNDPDKLKYKKDYDEIDYKDLMIRWYSEWVKRSNLENMLKEGLTFIKIDKTSNNLIEENDTIQKSDPPNQELREKTGTLTKPRYSSKFTPELVFRCIEIREKEKCSAKKVLEKVASYYRRKLDSKSYSYEAVRSWFKFNKDFYPKFRNKSEFKVISILQECDVKPWFKELGNKDSRYAIMYDRISKD